MQAYSEDGSLRKRRRLNPAESGPYVLRSVLENVTLKAEDVPDKVDISCVEFWNNHLYIGTTASEILHFVSLPADPQDAEEGPTFILASRLQPSGHVNPTSSPLAYGVKRILLLPGPLKACVLCNGVVSFYSLPELSPAFPNKEPSGVQWIGGIDENEDLDNPDGQVVMIANSKRILLVRVGEKLKPIKNNIEYPGCLSSTRRDTIACVADRHSYALLEVEHQQKNSLFPISSNGDSSGQPPGEVEDLKSQTDSLPARTSSLAHRGQAAGEGPGHSRSTSLGTFMSNTNRRQPSPRGESQIRSGLTTPDFRPGSRSPAQAVSPERLNPSLSTNQSQEQRFRPRSSTEATPTSTDQKPPQPRNVVSLVPHILSPSPTEFLLTTGTGKDDPGVGIFVNLEGDVVRGTIEFAKYPDAIVIDNALPSASQSQPSGDDDADAGIIALMRLPRDNGFVRGIETQSLSSDPAQLSRSKWWVDIAVDSPSDRNDVGIHSCHSPGGHNFTEVGELLRLVRLTGPGHSPTIAQPSPEASDPRTRASLQRVEAEKELFEAQPAQANSENSLSDWELKRNKEEATFARSLGFSQSRIMLWSQNHIWRVVRNPLILQLEATLQHAVFPEARSKSGTRLDVNKLLQSLRSIRDRDAKTESEFLSLNYIRQKMSLMLFLDIWRGSNQHIDSADSLQKTENALMEGGLDPRVILVLLPMLKVEVLQGPHGIWTHQGLADLVEEYLDPYAEDDGSVTIDFWMMIKRYLTAWQSKRGFGSITDEQYVFDSVDASVLHVLLHLDETLPPGSPASSSVRVKLNNVVDHWRGDFNRAVKLLESYGRLFVLSRLYQSRKLARDVLATWRRVAEGEVDTGGDLTSAAAEVQVQRYLVKIGNSTLVEEYGLWLAARNPTLASQVFTDETSRVKFSPQQVTVLLKERAPGAVQQYLEHLVFSKNLFQYADDLIGYYLDSVLKVLEHSEEARDSLAHSYSTYRALTSPKPTYLNFITENAPPQPWWQSRLRLLQLLGAGGYASASTSAETQLTYSIPTVLERLAPFSSFLVSESIILDARQGRHKEALRLLTHGLGDYDTAVRYCYFGGPAPSSSGTVDASSLPSRDLQRDLFGFLFQEFLLIEDISERIDRTSGLLAKFTAWFDPVKVLEQIPESWSVDLMSEFLLRTFRAITSESHETAITKGLSAAQNLQKQTEFIEACEKIGAKLEGIDTAGVASATTANRVEGIS